MTKLTTLERNIPLRAIPEIDLNKHLLTELMPWISKLLSLTDEVSANRLEMALPAIKEQCIGMGFSEIKKMFECYADGKLPLKPMTNFFDRILLGKIVTEYRTMIQKTKSIVHKPEEISEEEKTNINNKSVSESLNYFIEHRLMNNKFWVYDILNEKGLLKRDKDYLNQVKKDAIEIIGKEYSDKLEMSKNGSLSRDEYKTLKLFLSNIDNDKTGRVIKKCKILALEDFFREITKDETKLIEFKNQFK